MKAKKEFKSTNQQAKELVEKDVKTIMENIFWGTGASEVILDLIAENSNDFTKDIATRTVKKINENMFVPGQGHIHGKIKMSEKQAWCCAYQVVNNNEVYRIAAAELEGVK